MNQKYKELVEYMQDLQSKTQNIIIDDEEEIIVLKTTQNKKYSKIKM